MPRDPPRGLPEVAELLSFRAAVALLPVEGVPPDPCRWLREVVELPFLQAVVVLLRVGEEEVASLRVEVEHQARLPQHRAALRSWCRTFPLEPPRRISGTLPIRSPHVSVDPAREP